MNLQISDPRNEIAQAPTSPPGKPPSPPGPPGSKQVLQVREVVGDLTTIPGPGPAKTATAECESDEFVTGGGYDNDFIIVPFEFNPIFLEEKAIAGPPPGWSVTIYNIANTDIHIRAIAECTKLVDAP